MGRVLKTPVRSDQIAHALKLPHHGMAIEVTSVDPLSQCRSGSLSFYTKNLGSSFPSGVFLICNSDLNVSLAHVPSRNPRLDFCRALQWLNQEVGFVTDESDAQIHPTVSVGISSVIGRSCHIGEGTQIGNHVVIASGTRIGRNCTIKSGAVIGEDGFGFERDEKGVPIRMLHLGGVVIGDRVEIGSLTTVCRGTLVDTIVEDDAKIDDHVHIAHNCHISKKAIITACAELSGGCAVGEESWIAPNTSVLEKVKLAPKTFLGLGAVVIRDTEENQIYVGNPARKLGEKTK